MLQTEAPVRTWISSEVIDRVRPLCSPQAILIRDSKRSRVVVRAGFSEALNYTGGEITLGFAKEVGPDVLPVWGESRMLLAEWFLCGSIAEINPKEGLAIMLTALATINQAAIMANRELLHVAQCNCHTVASFTRLEQAGIYHYCDRRGMPIDSPVEVNGHRLFSCDFPVEGMSEVLEKFILLEAAEAIVALTAISFQRQKKANQEQGPFLWR